MGGAGGGGGVCVCVCVCVCVWGGGVELLISEIQESCTKNAMLVFITSHLSFEYHDINYTNTTSNQTTRMC